MKRTLSHKVIFNCPRPGHLGESKREFFNSQRLRDLACCWLIVLAFQAPSHRGQAQIVTHHQVTHYGAESGLGQSSVKNAAVDAWGYIWLATQSGLVRFDGRDFRSFNSSDIPGLSNDRFSNVGVSVDGQVWAQTANDQFIAVSQSDRQSTPVPRTVTNKKVILPVAGFVTENRPDLARALKEVGKGEARDVGVTACTSRGEVYLIQRGSVFYIYQKERAQIDNMPETPPGEQTNLSFTVTNEDVYMQLFAGNRVKAWRQGKRIPGITRLEGDVLEDAVTFPYNGFNLLWSRSGSLLYAGRTIYKVRYKNGRITTERAVPNIDIAKGLSAIHYLDRENKYILCIRGDNGGVSVVQPALFSYPALPEKIRSRSFFSQVRSGPDELYARNFLFAQKRPYGSLPAGSDSNDDYRTSYLSDGGELYFENNQRLIKYNIHSGKRDSLIATDGLMKAIVRDKFSNDLLLCTKFSISRLAADHVVRSWKIPGNSFVTTFLQTDQDHFLVGTENGLKWFDARKNKVERSILDSASIWSLKKESNGNIWISTYGKGFYLFDGQKLTNFPLGPEKALKTVHSFIDDGRGNFWMPTNNGLFKVPKEDLLSYANGGSDDVYYFKYDKLDGLTNNEFNGGSTPSHVWLADSMLSIPAIDGLLWFYPHRIAATFPRNPILLERVILNGAPVSADLIGRLPAGSHTIEMQINTPYLGNPENLLLEYQVSNYSTRWEPVPKDGKVLLQNFPGGNYDLIFRKRKNGDPTQYDRLQIPFRIAPFFYNTIWFYAILAFVLVAVVYLLIRWRTRNLKLVARRLELKVEERTSVLNNTIAKLEHSENQLRESDQIKDRLVSMVLHDLRSPIRFLDMMSTRLARNHKDLDKETLTERIAEIGNSTSSIYSFVNQFLTWTSTQHGLYTVRRRWIALAPLFAGINELYAEIARYHQNSLTLEHSDIQAYADPDLLMAILRNLVDNAMKYTQEGNISIKAQKQGDEVQIRVADTGTGMSQAQIAVFYGQGDQETYAGLGSTLVRDLLQKLEGRLFIVSLPGEGTAITIYLPGVHLQDHTTVPDS